MSSGSTAAGKCLVLDDRKSIQAWDRLLDNAGHLIVFDCSASHHAPPNSKSSIGGSRQHNYRQYSRPTTVRSGGVTQPQAQAPLPQIEQAQTHTEPEPEPKPDDLRDIPPLSADEDEDEDDRARLSQYNRESNTWLLFLGVFALINSVFLTRMTQMHRQNQSLREVKTALLAMPAAEIYIPQLSAELNTSFAPEALVQPAEEIWVPALWYSSLIMAVMCMFIVLLVKNWLMGCSMALFVFTEDEKEDDDYKTRLGRIQERIKEYKSARKEALRKTDGVRRGVLILLCGAVGMFMAGLVGRAFSIISTGR